jgi:hypothetical protein
MVEGLVLEKANSQTGPTRDHQHSPVHLQSTLMVATRPTEQTDQNGFQEKRRIVR